MRTPNNNTETPLPNTEFVQLNAANLGQYSSESVLQTNNIDWSQSKRPYVILNNLGNVLTFSNPLAGGCEYQLELIQPASGPPGTVTFPAVDWGSKIIPPTLSIINSGSDFIVLLYRRGKYFGFYN